MTDKETQPRDNGAPFHLSEVRLRRALRLNIVCGAMAYVWSGLLQGTFLSWYFADIGATTWHFGLLSSIILVCVAVQIPSALFVERLGRRKVYWGVTALIHRFVWWGLVALTLLKGGDGTWKPIAVIVIASVSYLLAHSATPVWYSWMTDLVPESRRSSFFGFRASICLMIYLGSVLLASWFLGLFPRPSEGGTFIGFTIVFAVGALFGCLDIILHLFIPEPPMELADRSTSVMHKIALPFRDKQFFLLMAAASVYFLGSYITAPFWIPFFKREWNMELFFMAGVMVTLSCLAGVVGSRVWGYVAGKYGNKPVLIVTIVARLIYWVDWLFISDKVLMHLPWAGGIDIKNYHIILSINSALGGFFIYGFSLCIQNIGLGLAPKEGRSIYLACSSTVQGLFAALGPLVGSLIISWAERTHFSIQLATGTVFGRMHLAMAANLAVWILSLFLFVKLKEPGERPVGVMIGRMLTVNPFRLMLNLHIMFCSREPVKKVRAVQKLGASRSRLALEELIEKIEDPDQAVREAAVDALGEMAVEDALEPLRHLLEDDEGDVRATAARALGKIRDPQVFDILLKHLFDNETEVQREVALALGRQGDPRAIVPLLQVLRTKPTAAVFAAVVQALSMIGEWDTIREILPVYAATRNARLRNRLAVAIADVVGKSGEFYPLLCEELRKHGSVVRMLTSQLRRRIRQKLGGRGASTAPPSLASGAAGSSAQDLDRLVVTCVEEYEEEDIERAACQTCDLSERLFEQLLDDWGHGRGEGGVADDGLNQLKTIFTTVTRLLHSEHQPEKTEFLLSLYLLIQAMKIYNTSGDPK